MQIRLAAKDDFESWYNLRKLLWPEMTNEECFNEFERHLQSPDKTALFVAESEDKKLIGFLETSIRRDYVEGCQTNRVGYIEGWFVLKKYRRQNVGRKLVKAAENWAYLLGCSEMASDCLLENEVSLQAHQRIGYEVVSRTIHFKKCL